MNHLWFLRFVLSFDVRRIFMFWINWIVFYLFLQRMITTCNTCLVSGNKLSRVLELFYWPESAILSHANHWQFKFFHFVFHISSIVVPFRVSGFARNLHVSICFEAKPIRKTSLFTAAYLSADVVIVILILSCRCHSINRMCISFVYF